ncbi:hypothetical protein ACIU1J_03745 [Azospirillum doebereinerae]|uniref:hypothetical protein n=1 Tax=Azospirillum doebereinerae TaxID=92933 RepID=UPI00384CFF73
MALRTAWVDSRLFFQAISTLRPMGAAAGWTGGRTRVGQAVASGRRSGTCSATRSPDRSAEDCPTMARSA